jgi:hypothetical protein
VEDPSKVPVTEKNSFQCSRVGLKIIFGGYVMMSDSCLSDVNNTQITGKSDIKTTMKIII